KPYNILAKATRGEIRQVFHRSQIVITIKSHGGVLIIQRYDRSDWRVGLLQYLYSPKGARGRPTNHEERDADARQQIVGPWAGSVMVPQRWDFCGVINPLLFEGRALVIKGANEVENAEANSK
ncbi:hypothetical protein BHM03_00061274, partial [Ensete ventricosum]